MAIEKFRFVSPGVQVNEIDESIIPPVQPAIGPVIIGTTAKGPAMEPVQVSSVAELEKVFGNATNGNVGAVDVWRSGSPTSPTLATYAAKAFLANSSPVTVIRLAGAPSADGDSVHAGWTANQVYELYAVHSSDDDTTTGSLAAILYATGSDDLALLDQDGVTGLYESSDGSMTLTLGGEIVSKFSLDSTKETFIRNALITNPTKYASASYFLGETFEKSYASALVDDTGAEVPVTHFKLVKVATDKEFRSQEGAKPSRTGWVVSEFTDTDNLICTDLFYFESLEKGSTPAREIKISIENIKSSKNPNVTKYGTFDVVVRPLFETASKSVLERFAGVNLDVNSDNYIVKRIGDAARRWNADELRYIEDGSYSNKSSFIRVVMSNEDIAAASLPHGFRKATAALSSAEAVGLDLYKKPDISLLKEVLVGNAKSKRFGLVAHALNNVDLVDLLRDCDRNYLSGDIFHTQYIDKSTDNKKYEYTQGTVAKSGTDIKDWFLEGKIAGFDMPMYNGTDAKDITVLESFVSNAVLADGTSANNPAFRAIKQTLNMVAQSEFIDMNVLCIPGLQNEELTSEMIDVCKTRGDSLALIDLMGDYQYPHDTEDGKEKKPTGTTEVISNVKDRQLDNSYGAAYFPAVFVPSEGIFLPASIAALGALAGTESRAALWFAPAGFNRGGLTEGSSGIGVSRTALHLVSSDRDDLYDININPIATFPSEGVVIFGQKTLQSTPSALDRVNVRRLLNYVKKFISRAATRVLFEPNVEATWNSFKNVIEPFLQTIMANYGLEDAKVQLDSSTTTADLIDRNVMYCKVFLKPTRAIEYIGIDFVVTNSGASFSE